jgi:metal-responsive CopG/Arc/MetJ family transcriptional regulator
MPKVKITISTNENLLQEITNIAQELDIPRSQVISLALEDYIRRYRIKQLLAQINEANVNEPVSEDAGTMEIIRAHQRKISKRD